MSFSARELHRRLVALDRHLADSIELFDYLVPLELGPPADPVALEAVERELGLQLPEPLRGFLREHAGSGGFDYALRKEHEEEHDADVAGAHGGFELLSTERMRSEHARIARFLDLTPGSAPALVPFARATGDATWLAVLATPRGLRIAHVHHDAPLERASLTTVERFFEDWSACGFRTSGNSWEDQPDPIVERFREAMGIEEEDE